MKSLSLVGALIGAFAVLLSPEMLRQLSGREAFWLVAIALVLALLGESVIPALMSGQKRKDRDLEDEE